MHSFTSCQRILQDLARKQGFEVRFWEHRLQSQWSTLAGQLIATHTWPMSIRFRKLFVAVEDSAWLHHLTYLKPTLLEKIRTVTHGRFLQDIVFRIGEIPEQKPEDSTPTDIPTPVSAEALFTATEYSKAVHDQELREALTTLIAKALSSHGAPGEHTFSQPSVALR